MENLWKIVVLATLICSSWGIYLGITKKAVFYMNNKDLLISFSGWLVILGSGLLALFLNWNWLFYLGCSIALAITVYSLFLAYQYNMNNLKYAIPIGLAKMLLGLLYVLTWVQVINPGGNSVARRRESRRESMIIIALITPLIYKLVNGIEIYTINGWQLPISEEENSNEENQ